jgi:ABC-type polar amino acid transport system ATPase subunit
MLEVKNISKNFGTASVLKDVSLDVKPGEVVTILGPSGSGKSTLVRCINGLEPLSGGDICVDDNSVSNANGLKAIRKISATVFQLFNLYPHMTVLQNITLAPIKVLGVDKETAEREARELLDQVGLSEFAATYPQRLSGGQRQRVGICRALAMKPKYLLLDEVTSALDPEMTGEVLEILAKLAKTGTTMLFVTHEIEFAKKISDRIVFMEEGRIIVDAKADDFFHTDFSAQNSRVARFLSKMKEF